MKEIELISERSSLAQRLNSIPGFGKITIAELAGEIGAIDRFSNEASLALYLGMAPVDQSSVGTCSKIIEDTIYTKIAI